MRPKAASIAANVARPESERLRLAYLPQEEFWKIQVRRKSMGTEAEMVTAEPDRNGRADGDVVQQKFRRMAPAKFGTLLLEAIAKARAQSREKMLGAYRSLRPRSRHGGRP
jgi:hypothetical protein